VTRFLLDVNVLVAMHVPDNRDHQRALRWFERIGSRSFATCAITEAGFVRVCSLLKVKDGPINFDEFRIALETYASSPGHIYWPMDISFLAATEPFGPRMHGRGQITDAFLLGLARHHGGVLATMDRATLHLAGEELSGLVEILPT
jgi:toxin-antitoxin system PIN domain toxin